MERLGLGWLPQLYAPPLAALVTIFKRPPSQDTPDCPLIGVAQTLMIDLEDYFDDEARSLGMDTEDLAHLWRHVVEAAAFHMVRLAPEILLEDLPE